jgi:enediyne biosynthesis protein E4
LILFTLALVTFLSIRGYLRRVWTQELAQARLEMSAGHSFSASERLARHAEHWTNQGEVHPLLRDCELGRGRKALAAWAQVKSESPHDPRAAALQATHLLNSGKYSQSDCGA